MSNEFSRLSRGRRAAGPGRMLKAVLADEDGDEMVLALFEKGAFFGELSLLDGKGRSATDRGGHRYELAFSRQDVIPGLLSHGGGFEVPDGALGEGHRKGIRGNYPDRPQCAGAAQAPRENLGHCPDTLVPIPEQFLGKRKNAPRQTAGSARKLYLRKLCERLFDLRRWILVVLELAIVVIGICLEIEVPMAAQVE